MLRVISAFVATLFCMAALPADAQVITLTPSVASAEGSATPKLTWSTTPAATSCTASGGWLGTRPPAGSADVARITASTSYTLTCTFPGDTSAVLSWTAPTQNVDGTPLTDLASYNVSDGPTATVPGSVFIVRAPQVSTTITGLPVGTTYFAVQAVNSAGAKSDWSQTVSKVITATKSVVQSTAVSITAAPPKPAIPVGLTVQ